MVQVHTRRAIRNSSSRDDAWFKRSGQHITWNKSTLLNGRQNRSQFVNALHGASGKGHPIWSFEKFKSMNMYERWKVEKQYQLCCPSLGFGHFTQTCSGIQIRVIDGFETDFSGKECGKEGRRLQTKLIQGKII